MDKLKWVCFFIWVAIGCFAFEQSFEMGLLYYFGSFFYGLYWMTRGCD